MAANSGRCGISGEGHARAEHAAGDGISTAVQKPSCPLGFRRALLTSICALAVAGCGDDNKLDVPSDPALFIGNWQVTLGSFNCPGLGPAGMVSLVGEMIAVTAAADAPIQATVRGCPVKFDLSGLKATARGGQKCMPMLSGGPVVIPAELTINSGSFAVAKVPGVGEQATGVLQLSGTVAIATVTSMCEATANVSKAP